MSTATALKIHEGPTLSSAVKAQTEAPLDSEALGRELDALRRDILAQVGEADVKHIRGVIAIASASELGGRLLLQFGWDPITFVVGTGAVALSKILENMEIGHNVIHGQYDWTGDPALRSGTYEWDIACTSADWRRYHNYEHHTFTNILGKDRDVGYSYLRVTPEQPWHPRHLFQVPVAATLAAMFQWGVATHGLGADALLSGRLSPLEFLRNAAPFAKKAAWQLFKDYGFYPAIAGPAAPRVAFGNLLANGLRNLWTFSVIFCGHFPEGVTVFETDDTEAETRGQWYARQIRGSANIEGGRLLHVLTGHLSHQIEHHLFPDIPAARYPEMAPAVRQICSRHGIPYSTGTFGRQLKSVIGRIARLSLPGPRGAQPTRL